MSDFLPSRAWWRAFFTSPDTWWQIGALVAIVLAIWAIVKYLRHHTSPSTNAGSMMDVGRSTIRITLPALFPALLWVGLIVVVTIFRKLDLATDILRPAVLLSGAAALVRGGLLVLRHSFDERSRVQAWEGMLTVTVWGIAALHILGWLPFVERTLDEYAFSFGKIRISVFNIVSLVLMIALMLLVALWLSNVIRWQVTKSRLLDESMKLALTKLSTFILLTIAVVVAMSSAGIDLTAFAVFSGALGVGLGLGLQRVISNFVSGFILVFEGSIRPGDVIKIGNDRGAVHSLRARYVVVHTDEGLDLFVPNETLLTSQITKSSIEHGNKVRFNVSVQIALDKNPEAALELLLRLARENPNVLSDPAPMATVEGFTENRTNLELSGWIENTAFGLETIRSDLCRRIWQEFRASGLAFT